MNHMRQRFENAKRMFNSFPTWLKIMIFPIVLLFILYETLMTGARGRTWDWIFNVFSGHP
jgi:hypothetical protein